MKKNLWVNIIAAGVLFTGCMDEATDVNAAADLAGAPVTAVAVSNPVQLFYSTSYSQNDGYSYFASYWVEGKIEIENIAYQKSVNVIYRATNAGYAGEWKSAPAVWVKQLENNKELWSFATGKESAHLSSGGVSFEFAISYKVNGVEYWDNNNGANYKGSNLSKSIVLLESAYSYYASPQSNLTLAGTVIVKNLAYDKKVEIVYTQDGWETSSVALAKYASSNGSLETWSFSAPYSERKAVEFAVKYTVNGYSAWDNKFNSNYKVLQQYF